MRQQAAVSTSTVGRLVVLPVVAGTLLAWCLIGDVSESGGEDAVVRIPVSERYSIVIGLAGLLVALVVGTDLAINWKPSGRSPARVAVLAAGIGVFVGVVLRVVTARVHGANIGGAFLTIFGPLVVVPLLVLAVRRGRTIANPSSPP